MISSIRKIATKVKGIYKRNYTGLFPALSGKARGIRPLKIEGPFVDVILFSTSFPTSSFPSGFTLSSAIDIIIDNDATYIPNSSGYTGSSGNYKAVFIETFDGPVPAVLTYNTAISTLGYENIRVKFGNFDTNSTGAGELQYSLNGGAWTVIGNWGTNPWELGEYTLPSGANNISNLKIRWTYPTSGLGDFVGIDDVSVIGDLIV